MIPSAVAQLNTGQEVELVNIGLNGTVLIKTRIILPPTANVRLRLRLSKDIVNLDGRIQRSRVVSLKQTKVVYEAAIILDGGLPQPLAAIAQRMNEQTPASEPSSPAQEINPNTSSLVEPAMLWVLDKQSAAKSTGTEA